MRSESSTSRRGNRSPRRRIAMFSLLMMVCAILVFLAIVSYTPADETNADVRIVDLLHVFTGDALAKAKADTTQNLLGLVGAMLAEFLVKSTVGYSILCFPVLLFLWGWNILRGGPRKVIMTITNYSIVGAVLVASSFGVLRAILDSGSMGMEWSGVVGDFIAAILSQLLGKTGASLVVATALAVTLVMAIDLDIHETADRLRMAGAFMMDVFANVRKRGLSWRSGITREKPGRPTQVRISKPPLEEPPGEPSSVTITPAFPDRSPQPVVARPAVRHVQPGGPREGELTLAIERTPEEPELELRSDRPPPPSGGSAVAEDIDYVFPSVDLLDAPKPGREDVDDEELKANADLLRATLAQFDVELESVSVTPGPVITLYELVPASGVKISRIVSLENDIALKLAAKGIRIMAPIPGKSAVGVEIPNHHRSLVTVRSVINSGRFRDSQAQLPIGLGKTISGEVFCDDLSRMPHLLIAGSTGSGKSVGINTILTCLLYRLHPADLKLVIIDPKKIELAQYAKLRNHFLALSPDIEEEIITNPRNSVLVLKGVECEMERRYDRLAAAGVRNIVDYNTKVRAGKLKSTDAMVHSTMPYLIVVIDELADLMITAAREVEEPIARLAQLARAVGIHLIVATQRPSVDVITGVIKANFPARIAYQVASKTDSRTILDMNGAEQLLGNGDLLYLASGSPKPVRLQNAFISSDEVDALMDHIGGQRGFSTPWHLPSFVEKKRAAGSGGDADRDDLFEEAARLIVRHQQGSVSLLQRRLKVGYSRAARLVDELESAGIVGPFDGSKAREVLVESESELDVLLGA
jgi:DNA segregation ATPase FtsK/SpoIIIE, S-DNA-T family